jgi:hypothetical protein
MVRICAAKPGVVSLFEPLVSYGYAMTMNTESNSRALHLAARTTIMALENTYSMAPMPKSRTIWTNERVILDIDRTIKIGCRYDTVVSIAVAKIL